MNGKGFSEGRIKGEIFLIHPLAVVKWHSAKATLPKSAKAQVNESALNPSRVRLIYCRLRHTSDQSSQSINRLFHPQCIQGVFFVCFFYTVHIAMNMARDVLTGALQ